MGLGTGVARCLVEQVREIDGDVVEAASGGVDHGVAVLLRHPLSQAPNPLRGDVAAGAWPRPPSRARETRFHLVSGKITLPSKKL